jgi:hypothetical protein
MWKSHSQSVSVSALLLLLLSSTLTLSLLVYPTHVSALPSPITRTTTPMSLTERKSSVSGSSPPGSGSGVWPLPAMMTSGQTQVVISPASLLLTVVCPTNQQFNMDDSYCSYLLDATQRYHSQLIFPFHKNVPVDPTQTNYTLTITVIDDTGM